MPLVTSAHDGRRLVVAATDAAAARAGLYASMTLAQAQAMVPGLAICPATPTEDAAALRRLAGWCLRYAPVVATDAPADVWIDVAGAAHLLGGERRLLRDLLDRLAGQGVAGRAAIADTPGAAWAAARFDAQGQTAPGDGGVIIPPGGIAAALAPLPVEALRLPDSAAEGLRLLGFERIGQLATTPRAPLVRRFGTEPIQRLDQALGTVFEPITPFIPPDLPQARLAFPEPLLTAEALSGVIARLTQRVCAALEKAGLGARRLDLLFERVDGVVPVIRIGTARPSRDPRHLARMLDERLERIDPGLGIEAMQLIVPRTDAVIPVQVTAPLTEADDHGKDIAPLVDRLMNRLGSDRVYRAAAVESDVPERAVRRQPALAPRTRAAWPPDWPRPVRLLDPPQPVEAMALLPDHPPVAFTWRRIRHRVRHADGPERIAGEWWKRDGEMRSVRDYFRVEDDEGRRFWLFRRGDGADTVTGDMRWFLHGFF